MKPSEILERMASGYEGFLFYDCEVFAQDNMVIFKDIDKNTVASFVNGHCLESDTSLQELVTGKVLVGYNNYGYDDYIISAMMTTPFDFERIKRVNDAILSDRRPMVAVNGRINSLDCFQQIKYFSSLKKVEGNLGQSIEETAVDFNLGRKLTADELELTYQYCKRDVDATIDVFRLREHEYFIPKLRLLGMLPEEIQERFLRYNTTTITAQVLTGGKQTNRWWTRRFTRETGSECYTLPMFSDVPEKVIESWKAKTGKQVKVNEYGCEFAFGSGGLHGVSNRPLSEQVWRASDGDEIVLLDVASMYPSIILNINALGEHTQVYRRIVEDRLRAKREDPVLATALKLVVNATYGLMKNEYSKLYNPNAADSVCIIGQAALFDLCGRLYNLGYEIINANTDGVCFHGPPNVYKLASEKWEQDYSLTLEETKFSKWIQRDVNNYVAQKLDGKVKIKGGDVNKYLDPSDYTEIRAYNGESWSGTNSNAIVSKAMVDYLVHEKSVDETIVDNLDKPILYQIILQPGGTFKGVVDTDGNRDYYRVNRVFASKNGPRLLKEREDGKTNEFPDMPEHMMVNNGDLCGSVLQAGDVDLEYYRDMTLSKLSKWPNPHIA